MLTIERVEVTNGDMHQCVVSMKGWIENTIRKRAHSSRK